MDLNLPPTVTDRAFARLAEIDAAPQALRIAVEGGGCSGFKYIFTFLNDFFPARKSTLFT